MKFTPPKQITFWISLVLAVLGVLATFVSIPFVSGFALWFVVAGYALLAAGLFLKGL